MEDCHIGLNSEGSETVGKVVLEETSHEVPRVGSEDMDSSKKESLVIDLSPSDPDTNQRQDHDDEESASIEIRMATGIFQDQDESQDATNFEDYGSQENCDDQLQLHKPEHEEHMPQEECHLNEKALIRFVDRSDRSSEEIVIADNNETESGTLQSVVVIDHTETETSGVNSVYKNNSSDEAAETEKVLGEQEQEPAIIGMKLTNEEGSINEASGHNENRNESTSMEICLVGGILEDEGTNAVSDTFGQNCCVPLQESEQRKIEKSQREEGYLEDNDLPSGEQEINSLEQDQLASKTSPVELPLVYIKENVGQPADSFSPNLSLSDHVLVVSGLPNTVHASDVKHLVKNCSKVLRVKLIQLSPMSISRNSRLAHVTVPTNTDIERCIETLDKTEFHGSKIHVSRLNDRVKFEYVRRRRQIRRKDSRSRESDGSSSPSRLGSVRRESYHDFRARRQRESNESSSSSRGGSGRRKHISARPRWQHVQRLGSFHRESREHSESPIPRYSHPRRIERHSRERSRSNGRREEQRQREYERKLQEIETERRRYRDISENERKRMSLEETNKVELYEIEKEKERLRIEKEEIDREKLELIRLEQLRVQREKDRLEKEKQEILQMEEKIRFTSDNPPGKSSEPKRFRSGHQAGLPAIQKPIPDPFKATPSPPLSLHEWNKRMLRNFEDTRPRHDFADLPRAADFRRRSLSPLPQRQVSNQNYYIDASPDVNQRDGRILTGCRERGPFDDRRFQTHVHAAFHNNQSHASRPVMQVAQHPPFANQMRGVDNFWMESRPFGPVPSIHPHVEFRNWVTGNDARGPTNNFQPMYNPHHHQHHSNSNNYGGY